MNVINPVTLSAGASAPVQVAASQTGAALGAAGTKGDFIARVLVKPTSTSPGVVTIIDGSTSYVLFPGGTLADVKPFEISVGLSSLAGAWTITTGANLTVLVFGSFT